jgi:hypothetical protein
MSSGKCKVIDAVNHRETKALMQNMNAAPVPRRAVPGIEAMRQQAMETIAAVKSLGLVPVVAATAAYVGHIRQTDRQSQVRQQTRGIERLE